MLSKDTQIFASFHSDNEKLVLPVLEQVRAAEWHDIDISGEYANRASVLDIIRQSGIILLFLSKDYARDDRLMLEEFAYAATVARRPFIPVWLDSLADIQQDYEDIECDKQLLSALEMLTAKHIGTAPDGLVAALEQFMPENIPYTPSTPQICEKPCEAYEGSGPYIFVSYAHDDAPRVYPIIKELYESGWDLWYDEGIKITERYLPVIAHHVKRCSVFVLILTNRCLERPFVMNYELEYARKLGIPVIPVLLEELSPQPWSKENAARLMKTAIKPDVLSEHIRFRNLINKGPREAVPPAVKYNVVYDVVLPSEIEIPGFIIKTVSGNKVTLSYHGTDDEVVIPGEISMPDGSVTFQVAGVVSRQIQGSAVALQNTFASDNLIEIGKYAFSRNSLKGITFPELEIKIVYNAFDECTSLTHFTLGGVTYECNYKNIASLVSEISKKTRDNIQILNDQGTEAEKETPYHIGIPHCGETPRALICCAEEDVPHIREMMIRLYWEGFNFYSIDREALTQRSIQEIQCVLMFFSENTSKSQQAMDILKKIILHDTSRIIQVFLNDCTKWPDEVRDKLHDRQAIFQSLTSKREFMGKIREGLRQFGCSLKSPRGFDVNSYNGEVDIVKFRPAGFSHVIIPKTFFMPPLPVTAIYPYAFWRCNTITRVTIPDGVVYIGEFAFCECESLVSVNFSDNLETIGEFSFMHCISLRSLTIPDGVLIIGREAFKGCWSLKSVVIPDSVTRIGADAFLDANDSLVIRTPPDSTAWKYALANGIEVSPLEITCSGIQQRTPKSSPRRESNLERKDSEELQNAVERLKARAAEIQKAIELIRELERIEELPQDLIELLRELEQEEESIRKILKPVSW